MSPITRDATGHPSLRREQVHLEDYWRVVRRRWWLIALTTGVAIVGAVWTASRSPQLYQALATLQVGDPRGRTGQIGDIDVSPNLLWTDPIESELQQLTTKAVASYVVDTLQLRATSPDISRDLLLDFIYVDRDAPPGRYELTVGRDASARIENVASGESAANALGMPLEMGRMALTTRDSVAPGTYTLIILSQGAAEALVTGGLAASVRPETNLIDITYTGSDQLLTPKILNGAASALRALGVRRLREWAKSRTEFIQKQLSESSQNLITALEQVEHYKEDRGVTSLSSEETRLLSRLTALQLRREEILVERNAYNRLIERVGQSGNPEDIQQFAVVSTAIGSRAVQYYFDRLLDLLEQRATDVNPLGMDPSHPAIRALDSRIIDTQNRLLASTKQAAAGLDARLGALDQTIRGLDRELGGLPAVETALSRLENQVEINSDMHKYLLSRYQESRIAEAEISPYVDVVDPATWGRPVSGSRGLNVIFGALLGLLLGVAAAFFLEYLDRSIQTSSDVENTLGLPVLATIPEFDQDPEGRPLPLVAEQHPDGIASEAYRVLRTNLAFSMAREKKLTSLIFTSPGPGEGKSTTVSNLATVLASAGDRTLLIDADLRRGELHEVFDLLRTPGLSDLLVGGIDSREAIRPEVRPNLDVLPAGQRPPNPSELLGSTAMSELLKRWTAEYRWVLLDTPPVLAVTDPAVLAAQTDAVVVVIRAGETDRRAAWRAFEQLRRVDARVAGAVLNELKPGISPDRYYIDYYYGRAG